MWGNIPNESITKVCSTSLWWASYTNKAHVAGTEGDRLSSLLVKAQWESLLSLPVTSPETNIFEAGTRASREALMGKFYGCGKRENKAERKEEQFVRRATKWIKRVYGMRFSVGIGRGNMKSRVWVDTYWPVGLLRCYL